jgi:hypothetical protein
VQVGGVDSRDGLLVSPAGPDLAGVLRSLDGGRAQRAVLADAAKAGLDVDSVASLLDGLRAAGLLLDVDAADLLATDAGPAAQARAAVELSGALGSPSAAPPARRAGTVWRGRRHATVVIEGATRVGTPLATILAGSGVGRVSITDAGLTTAADAVAGGLTAADEGRPRSLAAADAVRRASPLTDLRPPGPGSVADVVVLARPWAASDPVAAAVHRSGVPHLVATVRGETGVVGPFVVPGATSCLRCADLHRRDADPRWPALAAQLTATEAPPSGATVTCLLTAATAAVQVLAYLDGTAAPLTIDTTMELRPPDLVPRLRRWSTHGECSCGAPGSAARTASAAGPLPRLGTPTGETGPPQGTMGARPSSGAHPDETAEH